MAHALSERGTRPADGRWSDLLVRFISAAILGPIALYCLWHGGWAWALFILAAETGLALEWARLSAKAGQAGSTRLLLVALVLVALEGATQNELWAFVTIFVFGCGALVYHGRFAAAGIPYAGLGGLALLWLRAQPPDGFKATLFLVAVVWGTDIGAYLCGRVIGGAKMAPRISPAKTWAGAIGGLCAGGLSGCALAGWGQGIAWGALPAAIVLSIAAQAGDLLESAIKRRLGVKDTGSSIPGHGGLFDRLDGFLTAAPIAALLALAFQGVWPAWR